MMRYVMAVCAMAAVPVHADADPSWVQFFEAPDAVIERGTDAQGKPIEVVHLRGDVQVQRRETETGWSYVGVDFSAQGSVGCMARVLVEFQRIATKCPELTTEAQAEDLRGKIARLSVFFEANAVPSQTAGEFMQDVQEVVDRDVPFVCADVTPDFLRLRDQVLDPGFAPVMDELLSVPRLPVSNPCF